MSQLLSLPRYQFAILVIATLMTVTFSYGVAAQVMEPAVSGGVDFGPILTQIIGLAAIGLSVGGGFLIRFAVGFLASKANLNNTQLEEMLATRVDFVVNKAIDYAVAWAKTEVADPKSAIRNVQFDNVFIDMAVRYVVSAIPDTLRKFNLTEEGIKKLVLARLNAVMGTPAVNSGSPTPIGFKPFETVAEAA